jgi:hypothetical protein
MKREQAWRIFASEYNDSKIEIKGEGEMVPSYIKRYREWRICSSTYFRSHWYFHIVFRTISTRYNK